MSVEEKEHAESPEPSAGARNRPDGCSGCGGGCEERTPRECRGPRPVPWLPYDRAQYFYEGRVFTLGRFDQGVLQIRVTYQHSLSLVGRQQGPLLYTVTLLPGETVEVYEFDRYRRVRAAEERLSVHSSFRQTMSALSQTSRFSSASAYTDSLVDIRTHADTSVSAGGGLAGFFGAPEVRGEFGVATETTVASGASVATASSQFTQNAITAAQSTEAERSVVVSTFDEAETQNTTRRTLRNQNPCHAVTYYVRRVMEVYAASTRVESIEWRIGDTPWRSVEDRTAEVEGAMKEMGAALPRPAEKAEDARQVTLPTDGTLYEAELAHCSSCDPMREAQLRVETEQSRLDNRRKCVEIELLGRGSDPVSGEGAAADGAVEAG